MIVHKTKTLAIAALTVAGFAAAPALAQGIPDFATVDTDGNGSASLAEIQVHWTTITAEQLATIDVDGNGELSPEEFTALVAASQPAAAPAPAPMAPADPAAAPAPVSP